MGTAARAGSVGAVLVCECAGLPGSCGAKLSAVVAIADLLDCRDTDYWIRHGISTQEHDFGDYGPGRYGWLLNPRERLEPAIPAKGALGLWQWGPDGEPVKVDPQMELTL